MGRRSHNTGRKDNMSHETTKTLKMLEIDDHIFFLHRTYYYDFQEVVFSAGDLLSDDYEAFDNLEEAAAYYEKITKEA